MSDWKTRIEKPTPQAGSDRTLEESVPFSPRRRPSYPQLCILDDASENGETLRLRSDRLTIGRENCDLSFPAEGLMSRQHAMISLQEVSPDHWSWVLEDLSSRNGVFVRCKEFSLRPGNEFLIGGTKLLMHGDPELSRSVAKDPTLLIPYQANEPFSNRFELEPREYQLKPLATRILLQGKSHILGRNADGADAFLSDLFIEPEHVTLQRAESHSWKAIDRDSLNGTWLRISKMLITDEITFLIGEQRFRFLLPNSAF